MTELIEREDAMGIGHEPEGFVCDTDWKADKCLADIGELAALEAWIKQDYQRRLGQIAARREYLEGAVRFYAETQLRESGGKTKKISLPHGEAWFRKASPRVEVENEEACIEWLEAHSKDDCLNFKTWVSKAGLKAFMLDRDTGETRDVPGAKLVMPEGLQFGCKPRGAETKSDE